ncbi:purine-nucleoside phosphorylase [Candidatus Uhrbacteria bacterium]|nr:purine-nucleoside phosphorylase [Candidatus Uhrbacteria bacterium]
MPPCTIDVGKRLGKSLDVLKPWLEGCEPKIGLILGSGLGTFAETSLNDPKTMDYGDIPHFPECKAQGHAGKLWFGRIDSHEVLVMSGRAHWHEGWEMHEIVHPTRVMIRLGIEILIVTNAAGSANLNYEPGSLALIRDHINEIPDDPIRGQHLINELGEPLGPHHTDLSEVYSSRLRRYAQNRACALQRQLPMGVYAAMPGPSYETPSETRRLQNMGADLAGMSSAPEAIAARHMGAEVLGISCVTNWTGGIAKTPLTHEEVQQAARIVSMEFVGLVHSIIRYMPFKEEE